MTRPRTPRGAPGASPAALVTALLLPALAACAPASRDAVAACTTSEDCGPGARCAAGACQASTPPVPSFTLPAALTTNRRITVTATATDPDPGDSVAGWAWTVARLTAACDADVDVADEAALQAVFWCAGTYEVAVVATDLAGAASAPVRRTATVALLDGAPSVTVGPPIQVDHRCTGAPLRCELAGPVGLAASAHAPLGGPLTYQWSALPPDATRQGAAAVLTPSAAVAAPSLGLATGGGPISGDWRLRVRLEDGQGNLAQAVQVVAVGNRPPVVAGAALALDHRYEAGAYLASGPLSVPVSDPDGDPLDVTVAYDEPAGHGCAATFTPSAAAAGQLSLSCPGAPGLVASGRSLQVTAADPNGGAAAVAVPVEVRNRLPVVSLAAGAGLTELQLDHSVGACPGGFGLCFIASGPSPFVAADPDGDPVTSITLVPIVEPGRAHSAGEAAPGPGGGTFRFVTPVAYPAEFRAVDGAGGFALSATASDPFGTSAPAQPALPLRIGNRPPTARPAAALQAAHRYDEASRAYVAAAELVIFEDPDGDPLEPGPASGDAACASFSVAGGVASVACSLSYAPSLSSPPALAGLAGAHALRPAATDGWEPRTFSLGLQVGNRAPAVPIYSGAVEGCRCHCPLWEQDLPGVCAVEPSWIADPSSAAFPVQPGDDDGDPLRVTYTLAPGAPAGAAVHPASRSGYLGDLQATLKTTTFPVTVLVTADDGVNQGSGTWTATRVSCATAGEACSAPAPLPRPGLPPISVTASRSAPR